MKKRIISVVLVAVIVFGYLGLSRILSEGKNVDYGYSNNSMTLSDGDTDITNEVILSGKYDLEENHNYILQITDKGNIQIVSKTSDKIWKSVPDNDFGNMKYSSSVVLTYFTDETTKKTVYSSQDSVNKNQFRIYKTNGGIRVEYIFGEMAAEYVYPEIISKKRLETFLKKMNEDDRAYILRRYQLYVLSEFDENDKKNLLSEYPRLKKEDIYVMTTENITLQIKKKTDAIFRSVGYTEEDKAKDIGDYEESAVKPESFKISILYNLTQTGFQAKLDLKNCAFYNEYPIDNIQILPYFESFNEGEEGYFMIPSGCGALAYVNKTKTKEERLEIPVFGNNFAVHPQNDIEDNQCAFPMFGAYKENSAYICSFNKCGQQTNICAEINPLHSAVYPSFSIIDHQVSSLKSEAIIWMHASELSTKTIEADYHLIDNVSGEDAYSKMADIYRDDLVSQKVIGSDNVKDGVPMIADIINTINYDKMQFGCLPTNKEFALTTFDDSYKIAKELSGITGTDNLNILLTGWNYKGLGAQKMDKVTYSKVAGGNEGLNKLQDSLSDEGIKSYLDVECNYMKPHLNDRFNSGKQAVRDISNAVVNIEIYDPKKNKFNKTSMQLISPSQFGRVIDSFLSSKIFKKSGIGVNQFIQILYSDYTNGEICSRKNSIDIITDNLKKIKAEKISVIGDGANLYSIKYCNILNNVPIKSNNDNFFDVDIPFVQMVLHGYIEYTSTAVNDLPLTDDTVLKLIETGSGLHFRLTKNHFEDLFETDYSYLYNTDFESNRQRIKDYYSKVSKALEGLANKKITSHSFLDENIVKVTYEGGASIILNYSNVDFDYNGIVCKSKDYCRIN